jgi:hypothetical protein
MERNELHSLWELNERMIVNDGSEIVCIESVVICLKKLSTHARVGTWENHERPGHDNRCPSWESNSCCFEYVLAEKRYDARQAEQASWKINGETVEYVTLWSKALFETAFLWKFITSVSPVTFILNHLNVIHTIGYFYIIYFNSVLPSTPRSLNRYLLSGFRQQFFIHFSHLLFAAYPAKTYCTMLEETVYYF